MLMVVEAQRSSKLHTLIDELQRWRYIIGENYYKYKLLDLK